MCRRNFECAKNCENMPQKFWKCVQNNLKMSKNFENMKFWKYAHKFLKIFYNWKCAQNFLKMCKKWFENFWKIFKVAKCESDQKFLKIFKSSK
jgi:hypothetical protein